MHAAEPSLLQSSVALQVDLASINVGQTVTVKWRGKPVFIKHRTADDAAELAKTNVSELRDPQTDAERVKNPEWYVARLPLHSL